MFITFYSITFIIFLFFFLDNNTDFKSYAISTSSDDQHNSKREQLIHDPNTNYNDVNLPLNDTDKHIFIKGIVDTSFSTDQNNYWIATGNWIINLKNSTPIFNLNMTWYNNKESIARTYHIFNYESFFTKLGTPPGTILYTNGTISISLNNQIIPNIPITISVLNNKILTVYYNDIIFNRHFGMQPLHGIVTSITSKDISNFDENVNSNRNDQISIKLQQQNNLSDDDNNKIMLNDTDNLSIYNYSDTIKGQQLNVSTPSITTNSSSIIIPDNAALIGNPSYSPSITKIKAGEKISVINNDKNYHTVTSINNESKFNSQIGMLFDSGVINPQQVTTVDTSKLRSGHYQFECSIHPFMKGTLIVE